MNRRRFLLGVLAAPFVAAWKRLRPASEIGLSRFDQVQVYPPLKVSGWSRTEGLLKPGDRFTIAGRYRVNPETREVTEELQEFIAV